MSRMPDTEENFLLHCKMTCVGGSEVGDCPCDKPSECRLSWSPAFGKYRRAATERMVRVCSPKKRRGRNVS